jgi:IS5 family transposase
MEEALFDVPLFREFAQLPTGVTRLPDASTILRFRHLLEKHGLAAQMLATVNDVLRVKGLLLKAGTVVDATLIAAPSSTKNSTGERDPEMHQVKKGNQWHFGMKAHIGADRDSGLVHTVVGTAANVADVTVGHALLHGKEEHVFADAGYQGAAKRPEAKGKAQWHVALKAGERKRWKTVPRIGKWIERAEKFKASVRANDLPPACRTSVKVVESVFQENDGPEEEQIHRRADHWVLEAGRGRSATTTSSAMPFSSRASPTSPCAGGCISCIWWPANS